LVGSGCVGYNWPFILGLVFNLNFYLHGIIMDKPIIPRKYLYTIKWTQPYSTSKERPYLRSMHEAVESAIEAQLERQHWPEASAVIKRIQDASRT